MIDEENDWQQFREEAKERKQEKQESERDKIEQWCSENQADFEAIQDWHFRISKSGVRVDIYPQNNKYHCLNTQKRSRYKNIVTFLTEHFKK
jgi:hypothetical protein